MAIDNQFRISELISSGSRAIISKKDGDTQHTFVTGSKEVVNEPYPHLKGERDGEFIGKIEKPKYNEDELKKAVDTVVDELIGPPKKVQPAVVPKPVYDDLLAKYKKALSDLAERNQTIAQLRTEIQTLTAEIESLLVENDSLKVKTAIAENESQTSQERYVGVLSDFSNAIIKGTRDAIERVSLKAQVEGLQAQKESLRQLLLQTQSQLAGAQAESTAASSGLSPASSNETFFGFSSETDYGGDISWWTHRRNSKRNTNGKAGELIVQNLRDAAYYITKITLVPEKPSQEGWDGTRGTPKIGTNILGFTAGLSKQISTNIEQGAKEQFPIYFNIEIGGGDDSSPRPTDVTGPDKEYSGNVNVIFEYNDGFTDNGTATWVVRKQNGNSWG